MPRLVDKALDNEGIAGWRTRAIEGLHGVVVEPGFGSGLNVPLYPPEVTKVYAIDPATLGAELAADRLASSPVDVEFIGLDGQDIPLAANSCDCGLLTFTLCTIPEPSQALDELRRVIRPGGSLHFVEHGRSADDNVFAWQRRIDPVQKRVFDGCHVSRPMVELIEASGFEVLWSEPSYAKGPKPWSYFTVGRATNPT